MISPLLRDIYASAVETVVALVIYCFVGTLVYHHAEDDWTVVDSLYFCIVTMSTVGYGDFSPTKPGTKVFTIFMIFAGIIMVFSKVAHFVDLCTTPITDKGKKKLNEWFPPIGVDLDGNGSHDYYKLRHPFIYYGKNLLPSFALVALLQLTSAAIFVSLESFDFGDAFYHCIVTATTVGYGDISIETDGGKIWACFHICMSVGLLGELISSFDELRGQRAETLKHIESLERKLDEELLERLMKRARALRPNLKRDGEGLTELEFVIGMCLELEVVKYEQLRPFVKQFRVFDEDGSGRLGVADLTAATHMTHDEIERRRKALKSNTVSKSVSELMGPAFSGRVASQGNDGAGNHLNQLAMHAAEVAKAAALKSGKDVTEAGQKASEAVMDALRLHVRPALFEPFLQPSQADLRN